MPCVYAVESTVHESRLDLEIRPLLNLVVSDDRQQTLLVWLIACSEAKVKD